MMRSALLLPALAAVALFGAPAEQGPSRTATVVYLVRHAEKAAEPAADPPLTAAGESRARALADLLRDAGIGAVYSTQFARTRLTAAPTAARFGLEVTVLSAGGNVAAHARAVADAIRARPGGAVLVVGHSNTIPTIVEALGAPAPGAIRDDEYDSIFVVVLPEDGAPTGVRLRYGA